VGCGLWVAGCGLWVLGFEMSLGKINVWYSPDGSGNPVVVRLPRKLAITD